MTKKEWLNSPLDKNDLVEIKEGIDLIPYDIIHQKLDFLTDSTWSTKNFFYRLCVLNGNEAITGSIELEVEYEGVKRTLTGARTLSIEYIKSWSKAELGETPNEEYTGTLLSLCIVRASKPLGIQFGRDLNKKELVVSKPFVHPPFVKGSVEEVVEKLDAIKTTILMANNKEMAQFFLDKSEFKYDEKLQMLVNQKPSSAK